MFAALWSLALAPIAHGAPSAEKTELVGRVPVTFADLDLEKEADAHALLGRLEKAARKACGGSPQFHRDYDTMPRHVLKVFHECQENAIARAVADLHAPTVSRLFAETHNRGERECRSRRVA
jgi:UrcA family protein